MRNIYFKPYDISYIYYIIYSSTTIAIANLITLGKISRVKFHFQLPSWLVLWSYRKKITHAMCYERGSLRQQRTEDQAFISLHLQADQFCKSFTTHIHSFNRQDWLLAVFAALIKLFSLNMTHAYWNRF